MMLIDLILAFLIALILAGLLVAAFGRRGPGPAAGFFFFFLLLFLLVWAGGIWVTPFGPMLYGTPWLGFLLFGLLIALLLGAVTEPRRGPPAGSTPAPSEAEAEVADVVAIAVGIFFWLFVIVAMAAIIGRYVV